VLPLLGLASSDCERIGSGLLAQPTNTLSGLAFLVAGAVILLRARRSPTRRTELAVFGVVVAMNAVGAFLFHGLQTVGAAWVHDVAILSVLLFIVVFDVARYLDRSTAWTMRVFGVALGAVGGFLVAVPAATDALSALLGVAAGGWEVAEYRHELPALRVEGLTARRAARLGVVVALGLGATAFLVGRTGGAWCRPQSVVQWHAIWHILAAAAMALYAYGAIEPHPRASSAP
jgi:hypothetical protein